MAVANSIKALSNRKSSRAIGRRTRQFGYSSAVPGTLTCSLLPTASSMAINTRREGTRGEIAGDGDEVEHRHFAFRQGPMQRLSGTIALIQTFTWIDRERRLDGEVAAVQP